MIFITANIENDKTVKKYHGLVSSQVVIGANLFKDIFSGLSDIFGGQNKSYKRVLKDLEDAALSELSEKTKLLGGNAVIGLHIDQDEISGGGKSMFMIKAYGTAVTMDVSSGQENNTQAFSEENVLMTVDHMKALRELESLPSDYSNIDSFKKILIKTQNHKFNNPDVNKFIIYFIFNRYLNSVKEIDYETSLILSSLDDNYFDSEVLESIQNDKKLHNVFYFRSAYLYSLKNYYPSFIDDKFFIDHNLSTRSKLLYLLSKKINLSYYNKKDYEKLTILTVHVSNNIEDYREFFSKNCVACGKNKIRYYKCSVCGAEMNIDSFYEYYFNIKEAIGMLYTK